MIKIHSFHANLISIYSVYFILLIETELFGKCNKTFPPDENNTSNDSHETHKC